MVFCHKCRRYKLYALGWEYNTIAEASTSPTGYRTLKKRERLAVFQLLAGSDDAPREVGFFGTGYTNVGYSRPSANKPLSERGLMTLRIFYAAGRGDIISAHMHWDRGEFAKCPRPFQVNSRIFAGR
jgi:hypothetical protein